MITKNEDNQIPYTRIERIASIQRKVIELEKLILELCPMGENKSEAIVNIETAFLNIKEAINND